MASSHSLQKSDGNLFAKEDEYSKDSSNETQNPDNEDIAQRLKFLSLPTVPQRLPVIQSAEKDNVFGELKAKKKDELALWLDQTMSSFPNWYRLGNKVFSGNKKMLVKVKLLHDCYCGGGNRGMRLLDILGSHHQELTCTKFAKTAESLNRNDIKKLLSNKGGSKLTDLDDDSKEELTAMLNDRFAGKGWESFADEYNLEPAEKKIINTSVKAGGCYSPTEKLLDLFSMARVPLSKVVKDCEDLDFNSVVDVLKKCEKG